MIGLAKIAEQGLAQAVGIASALLFFAVIAFDTNLLFGLSLTPVAIFFGCAVLSFVLLRHKENAGITTAAIATGLVAVASLVTGQFSVQVLLFLVVCVIGTLLISAVLRQTVDLGLALLSAVPITMVIALAVRPYRAELVHFWHRQLVDTMGPVTEAEKAQIGAESFDNLMETMPQMLADSPPSWAIFIMLAGVLIARHWQAVLFNAGGFQREFHALKLGKTASYVCLAAVALSIVIPMYGFLMLASAMMFLFLIQGLSVLHCLAKQRGLSRGWLIGIYVLMPLPQTMMLLGALGLADNFIRIRNV